MESNIMEDKREIRRIDLFTYYSSDTVSYISSDTIKIKPYHENGECASVVWFMILENDKIASRINSKFVSVIEY